jgi:hypothetical protein
MTIGRIGKHVAPTPSRPFEFALFFMPNRLLPEVEDFFASLEEPDDYFLLVSAMRVDQLSWRPERIHRAHVRALTHQDEGVWVALGEPQQAAKLRSILNKHGLG